MADFAEGKLTESKGELSHEIDLRAYLGRKPTLEEKEKFADAAIETIKQRTLDGLDVDGSKFTQYSKGYADKKGVTRSSVDLFLEGDMLDSITRIKSQEKTSTVKIKVKGNLNILKGFNHQKGDTLPTRTWFGLLDQEAGQLAASIKEEVIPERFTLAELRKALGIIGLEQEFGLEQE